MILSIWALGVLTTTPGAQMHFWSGSEFFRNCLNKRLTEKVTSACQLPKGVLTFVTAGYLISGSESASAILALPWNQSRSGAWSPLYHRNGKGVGQHVCRREPVTVIAHCKCLNKSRSY